MKNLLVLVLVLVLTTAMGQNCNCPQEFEFVINKVEADYAGFADKVTDLTHSEYDTFTTEQRNKAKNTPSFHRCTMIIDEWLAYFKDKHLYTSIEKTTIFTYKKIDSSTVLIRIPTFSWSSKETIDTLILNHMEEITSTSILIIDVRGNSGGTDYSYQELLPIIYTNPYITPGVEWWASDGNIALFEKAIREGDIKKGHEEETVMFLDSLKAHRNAFVQIDKPDTIRRDTVYPNPQLVGVIVDDYCGSSCEQFVLSAKYSTKTTIFGTPTLGVLDYSNTMRVDLITKGFTLKYPMTRSNRLPENPIDNIGIKPDVEINIPINLYLRDDIEEGVLFVRDYLKGRLRE